MVDRIIELPGKRLLSPLTYPYRNTDCDPFFTLLAPPGGTMELPMPVIERVFVSSCGVCLDVASFDETAVRRF